MSMSKERRYMLIGLALSLTAALIGVAVAVVIRAAAM
jgi:hypothetical protein